MRTYNLENFDINTAQSFGIIELESPQNILAFSKWVSPKRTRSYPFARIYNTYYLNSKTITIIPIIKDEGKAGDNDRINFITFSWMNLLNVYIILAWYDKAEVAKRKNNLITKQNFDISYVKQKIQEISTYKMTALHWNTTHFEKDFDSIYQNAVSAYQQIGSNLELEMHSPKLQLKVLEEFKINNQFNLEKFKTATLPRSLSAANREILTIHNLEYLRDGTKAILVISNYLGGEYYLTVDEIYQEGDNLILQESKNSSKKKNLPSPNDLKDGLFKLILFSNLERLEVDKQQIDFKSRLKLTGDFTGILNLPTENMSIINNFCSINSLGKTQIKIINALNQEAISNAKLSITISGQR